MTTTGLVLIGFAVGFCCTAFGCFVGYRTGFRYGFRKGFDGATYGTVDSANYPIAVGEGG